MKSSVLNFVVLLASSSVLAQSLPPSPTASVGCEPHGDHWHCDGPATVTSVATTASSTHDHEEESATLPPSPTESVGCEPHGDHWHCDGPASATASPTASATSSHSHDDDEEHEETGVLPPRPTESVGCEPHGDHWHCDGPAVTSSPVNHTASATTSTGSAATEVVQTDGAGIVAWNLAATIGALAFAVGLSGSF
ncbi:hypothetical protein F4809DRAFT_646977 [Biscogniauxia mediterranea]|nr:hypothetical protein F4809DRAFT_646977 [Biscogniauxia mediterranea]